MLWVVKSWRIRRRILIGLNEGKICLHRWPAQIARTKRTPHARRAVQNAEARDRQTCASAAAAFRFPVLPGWPIVGSREGPTAGLPRRALPLRSSPQRARAFLVHLRTLADAPCLGLVDSRHVDPGGSVHDPVA